MRVYTSVPVDADGVICSSWSQWRRWAVFDVTDGWNNAKPVSEVMPRDQAFATELKLRAEQSKPIE